MPNDKKIELKGVIPPTLRTPEERIQALRDLQEFLRRFPGLAEEVMNERERQQQPPEHFPAHGN
jgi:hypothetical protein